MARQLKIAFFGSSLVSAYWNGAATYFRGVIRELHERGHDVTFYEPNAFERQQHRDLEVVPYARSVVYEVDPDRRGLDQALESAAGADVVIKASGVGVYDAILEHAILDLSPDQVRVLWDVDAPATLARMQEDPDDPLRSWVPQYDYVFTYGGGEPVVGAYEALGARQCVPIYNAFDPTTHYPVEREARFDVSLAFAGNRLPDREARVQEVFFGAASRAPREFFLLAGSGWHENVPHLENVRHWGHLYTKDHNAFNRSARAVLNVCRDNMASNGFSPPTRIFEAAGAGACLITDEWEGIEQFLEPGHECLVARNGAEVAELLQDLTPETSELIGQRALKRVLAEHTYAHRAAWVETLLAEASYGVLSSHQKEPTAMGI